MGLRHPEHTVTYYMYACMCVYVLCGSTCVCVCVCVTGARPNSQEERTMFEYTVNMYVQSVCLCV